jgi:hypothetical protein
MLKGIAGWRLDRKGGTYQELLPVASCRFNALTRATTENKKASGDEAFLFWVNDGTRTHDPQNHNLMF